MHRSLPLISESGIFRNNTQSLDLYHTEWNTGGSHLYLFWIILFFSHILFLTLHCNSLNLAHSFSALNDIVFQLEMYFTRLYFALRV